MWMAGSRSKMKKIGICLIFVLYLLSSYLWADNFKKRGAKTPERAVAQYLNALKTCDYNQIISCYPVETYVKNYDVSQLVEKLHCATPTMKMVNAKDGLLMQTGRYEVLDSITRMIKYQIWNLSKNDFFMKGNTVMMENSAQDVVNKVFPLQAEKNLTSIEFSDEFIAADVLLLYPMTGVLSCDISDYEEELEMEEKRMNKMHDVTKKIYGCQNIQDVAACFYINGKKYIYITETIEYGNKWYVSPNQGFLASVLGIAVSNGCIVEADVFF